MKLKDVPPIEWDRFKRTCPNVRLVFNSMAERINELEQPDNHVPDCCDHYYTYYKTTAFTGFRCMKCGKEIGNPKNFIPTTNHY